MIAILIANKYHVYKDRNAFDKNFLELTGVRQYSNYAAMTCTIIIDQIPLTSEFETRPMILISQTINQDRISSQKKDKKEKNLSVWYFASISSSILPCGQIYHIINRPILGSLNR